MVTKIDVPTADDPLKVNNLDNYPVTTKIAEIDKTESEKTKTINSMTEFYQLRDHLLIGTVVITLLCFVLVWYFYSLNTSLSYLLGACFSLVYVNMLAREVERVGTFKRRIGPTRLALFVGLIIIATQLRQLQVLPVFLGFMTYKASILFYVLPNSLLNFSKK
jgi:ATP synthase protein I